MKLFALLLILISFTTISAHAFELIVIQAVSETKKTFITRNGKRQGIQPGATGTFTAEDISVLAKAINVSGNFTQWQLINPDAIFPFEKGAIITYYSATEYIWALAPELERRKYIKSQIRTPKSSLVFKGAISRGLSETVSETTATTPTRGGYMGEIYYERDLFGYLAFDVGLRYEREVINYSGASLITQRNLAIIDLLYYFEFFPDYISGGQFFLGAGMGYGLSNTSTVGLSQSGPVSLLPTVKIGISFPFNDNWGFILDGASESLSTKEEQEDGNIQTTNQTNFKVGFGLRRTF